MSHHISLKSAKRQNLGEIQCNVAYLNHIYDPCARSRKNMRKSAEHNSKPERENDFVKKTILVFIVPLIKSNPPQTLCKTNSSM